MPPRDSYHLWHPDILGIFQAAKAQGAPVTLKSHMRLDAANEADVVLRGGITAVRGQVARFRADGRDFALGSRAPLDPACAYAFAVDLPRGLRDVIRVEYEGRATILDRVLGRNNLPMALELRVSVPSKIRRRRRHDRINCGPGRVEGARLVLVEAPPRRPADLERLLEPGEGPAQQQLLNLSVSGACLLAGEAIRQKLMAAQERYLVAFTPLTPERPARPLAFLGRKVGVFPRRDGPAALRIRFSEELEWNDGELRWLNIERNGSQALARLLRHWEKLDAEEAARAAEAERKAREERAAIEAEAERAADLGLPVAFLDEDEP
ncbi:MAG: hypothetical protein K2N07_07335 [Desulfovibrio sp.]|nr:hypothetical protein [Desulfovibrio sp.]